MVRAASDLTVVKLGGSHARQPHLKDWLTALAACAGRIAVVPGGGPFADIVRSSQIEIGFDDVAAHHMALLAMEQLGVAILCLEPRFVAATSLRAIRQAVRRSQVPVWMPTRMALAASDLPPSWEVTSDSLAAWLATRLGAGRLLLVKHGAFADERLDVDGLAARGVVDPLFPRFLRASGAEAAIAGPGDHAGAAAAIRAGTATGVRIRLHPKRADC